MVAKFDYNNARNVAQRIITQFGASGSFVRKGNNGGFDNDGNPIAATADVTISGIITPKLDYNTSEIDGEVIKTGDAYVYFHSDSDVLVGDTTTINGLIYRVVNINELESVDNIVVYTRIQLRR